MPIPSVGDDLTLPRVVTGANRPLYARRATLAYTDTTAKELFTLPAGAQIVAFIFDVTTAFDGETSNTIDVGTPALANRFVNDKACGAGATGISLEAGADESILEAATVVQGIYTPGGGTPSAGAAAITALYIIPAA
jgi:hypothetical protein